MFIFWLTDVKYLNGSFHVNAFFRASVIPWRKRKMTTEIWATHRSGMSYGTLKCFLFFSFLFFSFFYLTKVSASHRKSTQEHARPGQTELQVDPSFQLVFTCDSVWRGLESIFFDKRDLSFMSCTAIASKFKMHWFPNEGCYWAGKLVPLMYQSNRSLNIPPPATP